MIQDFSIWEYEAYHTTWDICIIGNGINGVSAGLSILERKPDTKILIVDRWFIPLGASTRNAGFSCFGSPTEILDDISKMGEADAVTLIEKRWIGLNKLKKRLQNSKAGYETNGGYELFDDEEFEKIHQSIPYLNDLVQSATGLRNVFEYVKVPQGIRGFDKAVYNQYEGQLHPGYMMQHLTQKFISSGGNICTGLKVDQIEQFSDHVALRSKVSLPVIAKKVIVSTNAFAADLLPELDVQGARNHVMVTEPIEGLSWKGCFHYDKGFYYFRNIDNRILLGGARNTDLMNENTSEFGQNPLIIRTLHNFLFRHLAHPSTKIDYQWSGIIAIGNNKLPIVKALSPRLFVGVRCSGMGIALASLIGEELTDLVLQQ